MHTLRSKAFFQQKQSLKLVTFLKSKSINVSISVFTLIGLALSLVLLAFSSGTSPAQADSSPDLNYYEQRVVELTNAKRALFNLPPLRLNRELTAAARWFSQDSVVNRSSPYCGHQATDGSWPSDRDQRFGYKGIAGAENAFCGMVTPEQAVDGWFNETPPNDGHRRNLLNPDSREIGIGYYYDAGSGRGYVSQDFGQDAAYPPLIINADAPVTPSANVSLYIYGAMPNSDALFAIGQPLQMRVSNRPDFLDASWESYNSTKNWTLDSSGGYGFKTVYVQLKDGAGKSTVSSDNIYYGPDIPYGNFDSLAQASTHLETLAINGLSSGGQPYMQFSPDWGLDSQSGKMSLNWGKGGFTSDPDATNGKAFQLQPDGSNESDAWITSATYLRNVPSQVYFRLKLSSLNAPHARIRLDVGAAGVETVVNLSASDFKAANTYQEFPVSFTQVANPNQVFLTLQVGLTDPDNIASLNIDRLDIYTAPEAFNASKTWQVPGQNYRGALIKVRYTDNANTKPNFSDPQLVGPFLPPTYNPTIVTPTPTATATPTATPTPTPTSGGSGGDSQYTVPQPASNPDPAFSQVWSRTDDPVAKGMTRRSWMWGDRATGFSLLWETYNGSKRLVQYHDKSRMEVNNPNGDRSSLFFVTNGLLVHELISGALQTGDSTFLQRQPASVPLAGDPNDKGQNPNAPTYASFSKIASLNNDLRASDRTGQVVTTALTKAGSTSELSNPPVTVRLAYYDTNLGHNIPDVFWNFMNSRGIVLNNNSYQTDTVVNWVYAMGYPLSEPYWIRTVVGGTEQNVLVQVFQRRVLTYTPANSAGFQVEMGNVGQHYYKWRYGSQS